MPCPCGSLRRAAECCRLADGYFYRPVPSLRPPGEATRHVHGKCYLRASRNCSTDISGEHPLSASVLRLIDERNIKVRGTSWAGDSVKEVSIESLKSSILCKRHNEALSPLDAHACAFFTALREVYDDIADLRTHSRKEKWFLFSGEALELWLVKTAFGLYEADSLAQGREPARKVQTLNPTILAAFMGGGIVRPCGLYVMTTKGEHLGQRLSIDVAAISSTDGMHLTGISLAFMGMTFFIALDPDASYREFTVTHEYRPDFLQFRNKRRFHNIVLTWPGTGPRKRRAVLYTKTRPDRL